MLNRVWLVAIAMVALIVIFPPSTMAQVPSSVTSRISQLERDNSLLESRISRLESALSRVDSGGALSAPPQPSYAAPTSPILEDPAFQRLATLMIELRDRIIVVEQRVGIPTAP